MKKFLTLCFALGCTILASAQSFPDASKWEKGQDISADLAAQQLWGDYSGVWSAGGVTKDGAVTMTPNPSPWWKGYQPNEMALEPDPDAPAMGFYIDGAAVDSLVDMYQIIPLPAGYYTVTVNAVYREGTPADTWTSYKAGNPKRNAHLYVNTQATAAEDAPAINTYDCWIKTLPYSTIKEQQYEGPDAGTSWKTDGTYTVSIDNEEVVIYYPNCDESAGLHFKNGNYLNTLSFMLLEDGYIRVGLKKSANIAQDWFPWANFRIYYQGPADEDAQIDMAAETYQLAKDELISLQDRMYNEGFEALVGFLSDKIVYLEDEIDEDDLESWNAAIAAAESLRNDFESYFNEAKALGDLIKDSAAETDDTEYEAAKAAAEKIAFTSEVAKITDEDENFNHAYLEAFNALSKARADHLDRQPFDENGAKDFTLLIKNPWFVNPEFNPTQNEDGSWSLKEETWADRSALGNPGNYSSKLTMEDGTKRTDICSDVILSADTKVTNQWYKYVNFNGWSPGLQLYYQSSLIGPSSGWNSISGGSEEICQQLVGLPEGYYSLKALMRGDGGAGWTDGGVHNIYAKNSAGEEVKSPANTSVSEANNGMGNNWYEWNPLAWVEHKTGIVSVPDGKLLIAAQTTQVMNATGFRLYFHGVDPDFDAMINEELDIIKADIENKLTFLGDKKFVNETIANIQLPLAGAPAYEEALGYVKTAKDYIKTASAYKYTAVEDYLALEGTYTSDDEIAIIEPAFNFADALTTAETTTYKDAQVADSICKAYTSYLAVFEKGASRTNSDEIKGILAAQKANLSSYCNDAAVLAEYEKQIMTPYYKEVFAELGIEGATEDNPVNVSVVLVNPNFEKNVDGWEGTKPSQNEYARGNAEIWNQSSVDMYQKLQCLPAGKYKVTAQALYRDGAGSGDLAKCYDTWTAAKGDRSAWTGANASVYAKAGTRTGKGIITSVCDTKLTENSFEKYYANEGKYTGIGTGTGKFLFFEELDEEDLPYADDYKVADYFYTTEDSVAPKFQYPFDGRVEIMNADSTAVEKTLFFPESMAGAALRFAQGEYPCEAIVNVPAGETLQVGISKSASVSGDWIIFTNFQLFYLGPVDDSTPEPNPSCNLLDDESYNFNKGTVGQWHYLGWNNSGTATNAAPGYNASAGAMALTSTNPEGDPWGAQLLCDLKEGAKIERGNTYIVSFWAKGTVEGDIIAPGAGAYPSPEWNTAEPAVLTTEWKQYTYTLEATEANTAEAGNTNIYFNQGKLTGTAYVDRVLVYDARNEINPDGNLITDDESFAFNGGTTGGWKMQGWNNAGTVAAVEPGWNNSAFALELTPNGSASNNYEAQLPYNLESAMEVGKTYTLSFYAKAENDGAEIEFGAQLSPWAAGNKEWNGNMFKLTTDWAQYSIEMTVTEDYPADGLNCLYINYGKTNGKAYVDHIVLVETIPAEVYSDDNLLDAASFGFEDGTTGSWNYLGWNNGGTFANATPGYGSEGSMVLASNDSAGDPWSAQLLCPLKTPVMRGGEYQITFYAKADNEGDFINPGIAKAYPEPEWNTAANAVLTKEWQKFTYTLVADESNTAEDGNGNFYFNHGKLTGNAYVDRVSVICTKNPETSIFGNKVKKASSENFNLAGQKIKRAGQLVKFGNKANVTVK